jgi:dTDP-glucose 4,6-dehydratase
MNILVTGGCGFQGSHIVESYAKDGDYVRIINTPSKHAMTNYSTYLKKYANVDVVWGSVTDADLVSKCMESIELIIHLAAKINVDESLLKPRAYADTNLTGTHNVLTETYKHQVPLIHASTCEVYGQNLWGDVTVFENARKLGIGVLHVSSAAVYGKMMTQEKYLMNELHPLNPQSPYAASKLAGDRMAYAYIRSYDLPITIVRPFNIFGTRQKSEGFGAVIPIFFDKALSNDVLTVSGDGTQTRDYLYITDLVEGYRLIAETGELRGKVVNMGSGVETEIGWLAREIVSIVGKGIVRYGQKRPGEVDSFICDNSLLTQYGFEQKITVPAGLRLYYDWLVRGE